MNIRLTATILLVIILAFTAPLSAGDLDPLFSPDDAGSALYTVEDIYQRLTSGTEGALRETDFQEPADVPGSTMHNLNDLMNAAPAADSADGAKAGDVVQGKKIWGLTDGEWGPVTGTLTDPYDTQIYPVDEYIDIISADGGATTGGDTATITGSFVTDGKTVAITVGGTSIDQGNITSIQNNQIQFTTPAGAGLVDCVLTLDGTVISVITQEVTADGEFSYGTGPANFGYDPPTINNVSGCPGGSAYDCNIDGTDTITILGDNFGTNSADISVTVGKWGYSCSNVTLVSPRTEITCVLPAYSDGGPNEDLTVTVNGLTSNQYQIGFAAGLTLTPGTIRIVSGSTGTSVDLPNNDGQQTIEIGGSFSNPNSADYIIRYGPPGTDFDDKPYGGSSIVRVDSSHLRFETAIGAGAGHVVHVKMGQVYSSESNDVINYPEPSILSDTIRSALGDSGSTSIDNASNFGQWIYFDVAGLGNEGSFVSISYGPPSGPYTFPCTQIGFEGADTIKCWSNTGTGATTDYVFVAEVWDTTSAPGTDTFSFAPGPTVGKISGCNNFGNTTIDCPTGGNVPVTITGTDFGPDGSDLEVYVGTETAWDVAYRSLTQFTFILQPGTGSHPVIVQRGSTSSAFAGQLELAYAAPVITSVSGCSTDAGITTIGCSQAGGTTITIEGQNLGADGGVVYVDGVRIEGVTHDAVSPHSKVTFSLPAGQGWNRDVQFINSAGVVSNILHLSYE
jgi:hypothetical protein